MSRGAPRARESERAYARSFARGRHGRNGGREGEKEGGVTTAGSASAILHGEGGERSTVLQSRDRTAGRYAGDGTAGRGRARERRDVSGRPLRDASAQRAPYLRYTFADETRRTLSDPVTTASSPPPVPPSLLRPSAAARDIRQPNKLLTRECNYQPAPPPPSSLVPFLRRAVSLARSATSRRRLSDRGISPRNSCASDRSEETRVVLVQRRQLESRERERAEIAIRSSLSVARRGYINLSFGKKLITSSRGTGENQDAALE